MSDDDLLPLSEEHEGSGFDVVLRGYDRRQVNDYVERVEVAVADAERQHTEDGERLAALELEVQSLQVRLADAEREAAGLPEPASRLTERLAAMLSLAEQEAEEIVSQARDRAATSMSERTSDLDRREAAVSGAEAAAEQLRLEAQRDAQELRLRAQQETQAQQAEARRTADEAVQQAQQHAEQLRSDAEHQAQTKVRTAEEDVAILHEKSREREAERIAAARQEVEELAAQRDTIAAQLQTLRETIGVAVQPLHPQPPQG